MLPFTAILRQLSWVVDFCVTGYFYFNRHGVIKSIHRSE